MQLDFDTWEDSVYFLIESGEDITRSDAQGLCMVFDLEDMYSGGMSPQEAVNKILNNG